MSRMRYRQYMAVDAMCYEDGSGYVETGSASISRAGKREALQNKVSLSLVNLAALSNAAMSILGTSFSLCYCRL